MAASCPLRRVGLIFSSSRSGSGRTRRPRRFSSSSLFGQHHHHHHQTTTTTTRQQTRRTSTLPLMDEAMMLMSMQHGHDDGPWQLMSRTAEQHYYSNGFDDYNDEDEDDKEKRRSRNRKDRPFQVLDLACGPRGQPGSTIATLLPVGYQTKYCRSFYME
jgi:hypothetical protein